MRVLSYPDLKAEKGIRFTRQHIHRLVQQKKFPAPVKLGQQTNAWIEAEVFLALRNFVVSGFWSSKFFNLCFRR